MSNSLSGCSSSFSASNNHEKGLTVIKDERDKIWLDMSLYDKDIWMQIRMMLGPRGSVCDVDDIHNAVKDEFQEEFRKGKKLPPTEARIRAYLLQKARWRSRTYLKSQGCWSKYHIQLSQIDEKGKEYDLGIPDAKAEEAFLRIEELQDNLPAIQLLRQAMDRLTDIQRICFIMRYADKMKPREIAAELVEDGIPITSDQVTGNVRHAIQKVLTFFDKNGMEQLWKT